MPTPTTTFITGLATRLRSLGTSFRDWLTRRSIGYLAAWCNEKAVQRIADRINSDQLYELIDGDDFTSKSQEQQNEIWNILQLFANSGAQSTTIANVVAAITYQVSRAAAASVGADSVRPGDVQYARTLA